MKVVKVVKYKLNFPRMTKELFEEDQRIYQILVWKVRMDELGKKMKLRKIGKATKNGTNMTFVALKDEKEFEDEFEKLKKMAKIFER